MHTSNLVRIQCTCSVALYDMALCVVQSGMTNAERWLEKYYNEWNESVDPVYTEEFTY